MAMGPRAALLLIALAVAPPEAAVGFQSAPDASLLRAVQRSAALAARELDPPPLGEKLARAMPKARPTVAQAYAPLAGQRRRGQQASGPATAQLTVDNTAALRIHVDYSQLFEESATPYSACFREGDWFRWNFAALPPGSGDLCDRRYDAAAQNCWGICEEGDVLTPAMRDWMMRKIELAVNETQSYFRVRRRSAPLTFSTTRGVFWRLYEEMGEDAAPSCAKDAALMYRLPVSPSYCSRGVDADAVFFPTMAQMVPGVAGWGTDVMRDQAGRPVFLLMGWSVPSTEGGRVEQDRSDAWRRTVVHELIHGLGFSIQQFSEVAVRSNGAKRIVELQEVADVDGSTDEVWVATGARTLEIARQYFNCSSLSGVPLMGENPLGDGSRGSHWETRLLADDIMAYGNGASVSAFTLAALEDTGFYLADHSRAGCIAWGRAQGCAFVSSRCGIRRDDLSVSMPAELCAREHPTDTRCTEWETSTRLCWSPDAFLATKCADPGCSRGWGTDTSSAAHELVGGIPLRRCNAECVSDAVTNAVQWQPAIPEGATTNSSSSGGNATDNMQVCGLDLPAAVVEALLGADDSEMDDLMASGVSATIAAAKEMVVIGTLIIICTCGASCCNCCRKRFKPSTIRALSIFLNGSFVVSGLAAAATAGYALYMRSFQELFSNEAVHLALYSALGTAAFSALGCLGAFRRSRLVLLLFLVVLIVVVAVQIGLAFTVAWWIETAYASAEAEQYLALQDSDASEATRLETGDPSLDVALSRAFSELEGYSCNLYRTCCMQSEMLSQLNNSCTVAHKGATVGAAAVLRHDPSSEGFCLLLTGSRVSSQAPPAFAQCLALEEAGVVDLVGCSDSFCDAGIDGFRTFMASLLAWLRDQAGWMALGISALIVLQILSAVLTWMLIFHSKLPHEADGQPTDRTGLLQRSGGAAGADTEDTAIELSERIDIRTQSVADADAPGASGGGPPSQSQLAEERAKFKRKIAAQLAQLERP